MEAGRELIFDLLISQCRAHALAEDDTLSGVCNGIRCWDETSRPRAVRCSFDQIELRDIERFDVDAKGADDCIDVVQVQDLRQAIDVFIIDLDLIRSSVAILSDMSENCLAGEAL